MARRDDWYRKTTWASDDAVDFFARLALTRTDYHRAQYLKIQALTLKDAGQLHPALELAEMAIKEFPNREAAELQKLRADCLWALGLQDESAEAYRAAIQAQRAQRNIHCNVALAFAETFHDVDNGRYRIELLDVVREEVALLGPFPFQTLEFRYAVVFARLFEGLGDLDAAAKWAGRALAAQHAETSGLPHYSALAVARTVEERTEIWLRQLAACGDR